MNKNILGLVLIVVVVLAVVMGLAVWLKSAGPSPVTANPNIKGEQVFVRPYSYMAGKAGAKVTLVEFGDFQCPACAQAFLPTKQIVDKYISNPDFNFVFRNFPLAQHSNAMMSAEAAEAAGAHGRYWDMIELLYLHQNDWAGSVNPINIFVDYTKKLGLDADKFKDDVKTSKYIDNITQDKLDGDALGVNSTPTFFLNGQKINGYADLDVQINALLTK